MNCPPDESMMEDRHSLYLTYVQWFALVLIRLQLHFHISNRAINLIVTAFAAFLSLISHPIQSIFPSTLYSFLKLSAVNKNTYIVLYVVCPNGECNALYKIKEVRHADKHNQQPCCTAKRCSKPLAWLKKLAFGTSRLVPYKTFIYTTPSAWLRKFTQREEFDRLLEGRFHQDRPDGGAVEDIWDGQVWKDFSQDPVNAEVPFLDKKWNIGLMMSIDWVQPILRGTYKIGPIHMSVLNLPRSHRMRQEWTMLIGIMSGPSEPKRHIDTFFTPVFDDLLYLWDGIEIPELKDEGEHVQLRAALLCVSPAGKKINQFLLHKACKGCSQCNFQAARELDASTGFPNGRMSYFSKIKVFPPRQNEEVTGMLKA